MAREGVAQDMRTELRRGKACSRRDGLEITGEGLPRHMSAGAVGGKEPWRARKPGRRLVELLPIGGERRARRTRERDESLLAALAPDRDQFLAGARRGFRQSEGLRNAQARSVDEFDQRG